MPDTNITVGFQSHDIHTVREQGLVGTGDEAASGVRGHVEEWTLCASQRSHQNRKCSVNGEDKTDCVSQLIATVGHEDRHQEIPTA